MRSALSTANFRTYRDSGDAGAGRARSCINNANLWWRGNWWRLEPPAGPSASTRGGDFPH